MQEVFPKVLHSATISCAANADLNKEYAIVGGGNAVGYAVRAFTEHGVEGGKICLVSKEKVPPYERPALTKAYLFPLDKSPARIPGFHTCVGTGNPQQTDEWYKDKGIEVLDGVAVTGLDANSKTLSTSSGSFIEYNHLIIATGASVARLPKAIGGELQGVQYIRDVADADALVDTFKKCKKLVIIGGGYIGMEVAAAAIAWKLDTTMVFPEVHIMPRLFTPSIAEKYEELLRNSGVGFIKEEAGWRGMVVRAGLMHRAAPRLPAFGLATQQQQQQVLCKLHGALALVLSVSHIGSGVQLFGTHSYCCRWE